MKQNMASTKYDRAFITGCDAKCEWQLKWFLDNYRKHNDTPIVFCDFGVTPEVREWAYVFFVDIYELPVQRAGGWFYKPRALMRAPARERIWIDTDMHVLGDISGAFDLIEDNKLAMVEDRPWTKRRGETWHNSGFVGVRGTPTILMDWEKQCVTRPKQGDQEVLHDMLNPILREKYITSLPNKYNWLRIQLLDGEDSPEKLCMHWTGMKGNMQIEKMIYNES